MKGNSFKFNKSFYSIMRDMTDKQAGEFIKGICGYAFENKPFITKDEYLKGVYLYVKREIDVSKENSVNGRKGGLISAEIRKNDKRENAYKEAMSKGGVIAEQTLEILISGLKSDSENSKGKDGKVVAK